MKIIYTLAVMAGFSFCVSAQTTNLGNPLGWSEKIEQKDIPLVTMPGYDQAAIDAEDAINDQTKDQAWRFGYKYPVNYNLDNSGKWTTLPSGTRIWQLAIECSNALTINLLLDDYNLPAGSYLYLYDEEMTNRVGAYTSRNNRTDGELGTELVHGDKIIVEYVEPAAVKGQGSFTITDVVHGYRSLDPIQKDLMKALNSSGDCNVDVNCPLGNGWEEQIRSVAMIVVNGSGICSGALINNTCDDGTAYFLTANHCLGGGTGSWAFRFNWESPLGSESCATTAGSTDPGPPYDQTANGATTLVSGTQADHALLEIDNMTLTDAQNWNCFFAGWDNSDAETVTQATGIHHPSGDVKKICREDQAPYHTTAGFPTAQVWMVDDWDQGVTEPGSSGSPLFDQNGRIIGQLYGGAAACSGTNDNNQLDYYGRLGVSWPLGIGNYLAPSSCGTATTNDGWDPNAPSLPDDAAISSVAAPTGFYCSGSITPEVTLKNEGTNNLTSATINYDVDGGTNQVYNWTGNLVPGASVNITLSAMAVASGSHTFNASTTLPNGTTDSNTGNDAASSSFTNMANGQDITLEINLDCYGSEVTWEIQDIGSNILASGGPYTNNTSGELITFNTCLDPGCYDFIINDTYGDGLYGSQWGGCSIDGDYTITQDGTAAVLATIQAANGDYGAQEINNFCVVNPCSGTPSSSATNVPCFGGANGQIDVSMTGGNAPFTYDIGNGPQSSGSFSGLTAGNYTVTIIDNNSCSNSISIDLSEPTELVNDTTIIIDESCLGNADGSISLAASGGTVPYQYSIDCGLTTQSSGDFVGLSPATYSVSIEDANGCTVSCMDAIVASGAGITGSTVTTETTCNGSTDGAVTVTPTNGTAPYTFDIGSGSQSSDTFNDLAAGNYSITITDNSGCSGVVNVDINEPTALSSTYTSQDEVNGNDGNINISVSGGTSPYSYSWSGPNGFSSTQEDPDGLESGDYVVTITDNNGCTYQTSIFVDSQLGILENGFAFTIYPNPTNGTFNIDFLNFEELVEIRVVDVTGRVILTKELSENTHHQLDISTASSGAYFITLKCAEYQLTRQIIKR